MQLWRKHPGLLRAAALLVSLAAALLPGVWYPQAVDGVEERVGDAFWRLGATAEPERRVVLVDIDEKSLQAVGPWPWSRSTLAELSTRLTAAGARVQAYDINFSDPRPGDDALAAAWSRASPVVAQLFSLDAGAEPGAGSLSGALRTPGCPRFAPKAFGYYGTAAGLLSSRPAVGHITPQVSADGVIRQVPAVICQEGKAYASLALMTLWQAAQPEVGKASTNGGVPAAADWQWHSGREASPFPWGLAPPAWMSSPSLPGLVVPLDRQGNSRVPYALKREAFASVSAADVLAGAVNLSLLRGAIVVVGATAFGMSDTVATPHGSVASGLEIHSQALVGLLDQNLPYTPASWPFLQALVMGLTVLVLLGLTVGGRGVPAKRLPLIGILLSCSIVAAAGFSLLHLGLWLPWLPAVLFAAVASISLATVEHALTRAQRERLSAHLGAYLPATVARRLMASEPSGSLQLEKRNISVLVADIRNFTALATHGQPEEVAALLHAFCCEAVDVVERHGGVVENVMGDSLVAVWTADVDHQDHAQLAVSAAQELIRTTRTLLASRSPVSESSLVQPLALGLGLESGVAIVGSFGPARRRAHAALGEPVSVASRIQQMTADLSMPILVGPQLAALLSPEGVEPLGEYLLEGLGKHYTLYAPVGWADLAAVDSNWASSAVGSTDRQAEGGDWSRWGDVARPGSSPSGTTRTLFALRRHGA